MLINAAGWDTVLTKYHSLSRGDSRTEFGSSTNTKVAESVDSQPTVPVLVVLGESRYLGNFGFRRPLNLLAYILLQPK